MKKTLRVIIISQDEHYTSQLVYKLAKAYSFIDVITITNEAELFPVLFKNDLFNIVCLKKDKQISEQILKSYDVYEDPKYNLRVLVFQESHKSAVNLLNKKTASYIKTQYPFLSQLTNVSFFDPEICKTQ